MKTGENRAGTTVIQLQDIGKSYFLENHTEVPVLTQIDLIIERGEFVSVMGPSGAGKSTLMNILGCLDRPTKGSYLLDGEEVASLNDNQLAYTRNKKIGFVFQSFNLLPRLSALDNVILPMIYGNVYKSERKERAARMLAAVGLGDRRDHMPAEMSGGQRQRVAIARALVNDPAIIMADEPTGNLDSKSTKEVMEIFSNLHKAGKTVILVTHELSVAEYANRHVILSDGHISKDIRGTLG
ncbi:MAG: ABC transporter ATP-binding protein [Dialister sp.]|nr:ABC transporter ATP-binding protein [Dialister sp.]